MATRKYGAAVVTFVVIIIISIASSFLLKKDTPSGAAGATPTTECQDHTLPCAGPSAGGHGAPNSEKARYARDVRIMRNIQIMRNVQTMRNIQVLVFVQGVNTAKERDHQAAVARYRASRYRPAQISQAPHVYSSGSSGGCAYAGVIRSVWQQDAEWAIGIAKRESRCQAGAYNPSGASGLLQMLGHGDDFAAVGCSNKFDAECNIRAAYHLYLRAGRSPWNL